MAGFDNEILYSNGIRLEESSAQDIFLAQKTNSVSELNISGSPEGVVSANPSSLAHDRSSGNIYVKATGTGNTGWVLLTNADTDLYISPYIVDGAGGPGSSFTTIQAAVTQAIADAVSVANIYIRPGTYTENITLTAVQTFNFVGIGNTNGYSTSNLPYINGTLTINNGSNSSISGMRVSTLTLTSSLEFRSNDSYFNTINYTTGTLTITDCRIVTFTQDSSGTSQFFNCQTAVPGVTLNSGSCFLYGGNYLSVVLAGTANLSAYSCFINTSGSTSGTITLGGCSGGGQIYNATSQINQGVAQQGNYLVTRAVSSSGSTSGADYLIEVNTSGGAVTLTVPVGTNNKGYSFIVKDVGGAAATNNITITPTGKTIDGVASKVISTAYGSLTIYYNGTNFFTI